MLKMYVNCLRRVTNIVINAYEKKKKNYKNCKLVNEELHVNTLRSRYSIIIFSCQFHF